MADPFTGLPPLPPQFPSPPPQVMFNGSSGVMDESMCQAPLNIDPSATYGLPQVMSNGSSGVMDESMYQAPLNIDPSATYGLPQVMSNGSSAVMDESMCQAPLNIDPIANTETERDPDDQALETLSKAIKAEDYAPVAVENQNLELDPQLIPAGQFIVTDRFDLLVKDSWDVPASAGGGSCWKKHGRELGWGVRSSLDVRRVGYKRTFVFHRNGTKTDWIMNVYALVEKGTFRLNTTKFLCQVFQNNMYDPRPLHSLPFTTGLLEGQISAMLDPFNVHGSPLDTAADANNKYGWGLSSSSSSSFPSHLLLLPRDPNNYIYGWGLSSSSSSSFPSHPSSSFQGDFMAPAQPLNPALLFGRTALDPAHKTSTGDENCNPNAAGSSSSTGIASGKKRKSSVYSKFTEIYASNPEGKVLTLLICNRCGVVYNKTSGTGTLAAECDSDVQALVKLHKIITEEDGLVAVENQNLGLDPQLIPGEFIVRGSIDLLFIDSWDVPASAGRGSCWKKHGRGLGWAVGSTLDDTVLGYKRTFVFHRDGTKTDWIMTVYAVLDGFQLNTTKFLCQVFQNNMYDPRPLHSPPFATGVLGEDISARMHDPLNFHGSPKDTGDENPNAAGSSSSTGIASGKKRKSSVYSKFTEIYASNPEGKVLTLLICNRCGMVYNKKSGTSTLGKHKCNDH